MRKIIVSEWMTLDGVVQSPTSPDEDASQNFAQGGWHARHFGDPLFQQSMVDTITAAGGFLLGRRTYDALAAYWPNAPEAEAMLAVPLNTRPKYVVSSTLTSPSWQNTSVLTGNIAEAVGEVKRQTGGDLVVFGSTHLVRTLIANDLVDEFRLMIDPVLVGGGKRIFDDDGARRMLKLVDGKATPTGAILATYVPEV
ncbi:MAG TPA: dihydrofolate reductase family protein [Longimicrobiales bacterium]